MSYVTESYIEEMEYQELWDYANMITEGYLDDTIRELRKKISTRYDEYRTYIDNDTNRIGKLKDRYQYIVGKLPGTSGLERAKMQQEIDGIAKEMDMINGSWIEFQKSFESLQAADLEHIENLEDLEKKQAQEIKDSAISMENIKRVLSDTASSIWGFLQRNATVLSVTAIVILVSVLAYKLYKKYKDGNCAGLKGKYYNECKISGINKTIKVIKKSYNTCIKSKDPDSCKYKLKQLIDKWEEKKKQYQTA
jgi:hypothetical protein